MRVQNVIRDCMMNRVWLVSKCVGCLFSEYALLQVLMETRSDCVSRTYRTNPITEGKVYRTFPSSLIIPNSPFIKATNFSKLLVYSNLPIIYFDQKSQTLRLLPPPLVFRTQEHLFFILLVPNIMKSFRTCGFFRTKQMDGRTDRRTN